MYIVLLTKFLHYEVFKVHPRSAEVAFVSGVALVSRNFYILSRPGALVNTFFKFFPWVFVPADARFSVFSRHLL